MCPLIVFLAFTKEVIAGWNLEATEATEARVLLAVHAVMETRSLEKPLGVPLHNFAGKALQSLQAYHLVQRGFSGRVQCRFALLAVLCVPKGMQNAWKTRVASFACSHKMFAQIS